MENETEDEEVEVCYWSPLGHKALLSVTQKAWATKLSTLDETAKRKPYGCPHATEHVPYSLLKVTFYNELLKRPQSKFCSSVLPPP